MNPRFVLPAFALFGLLFFSCKKDDTPAGFDMQYRQEFSIPAGLSVFAVHHFYLKNIPSQYATLLDNNGKTDADIAGIIPTKAELSGIFGDASFDFIEEASIRLYLEKDPTDYLECAYRLPVPLNPGNSLPLIPGLGDVKKYLSEPRFSVDVSLRLRRTTDEETTTRLDLLFRATH
ncbi:MAG: hypothetical protein ACK4Q5_01975 [Saprospiraceae bacterium]